ncbi:MAG TPA: Rieske 2Fe-2S domain-containing protein [Streptosporangiaceae bacterium]
MSNINTPGAPGQPGPGDTSWPGYLTGSAAQGHDVPAGQTGPEGQGGPRRVIGTPPPSATRTMLPEQEQGGGARPPVRELPAEPDDPKSAKRAELIVAACFILAMLAGLGFLVAYGLIGVGGLTKTLHSNLALGSLLSLVFLLLGAGAVIWVRRLMPNVELTEQRHLMRSTEAEREAFKQTFTEGAEASQFVKRPLIRRTLIAATLPLAVAPVFLLRDTGPVPGKSLDSTVWRKGLRLLVYGTGRPITPAEFNSPGGLLSVGPEGFLNDDDAMAKAAVIIIKFRPGELDFSSKPFPVNRKVVQNWTVDNIVAYSKICTHLGCPAALYEQTTHHILCPCHQSTFDATKGAQVIFGPATRPLPQLPIGVDSDGFLIALSDFDQPVGPSYWERGGSPS